MTYYLWYFWNNIIKSIFRFFVHGLIFSIIDKVYPIVDIQVKYSVICLGNKILTVEYWDKYVEYLRDNKSNMNDKLSKRCIDNLQNRYELDYFDILILPKIARINRKIKMRISESCHIGSFRAIEYHEFYDILKSEIGDTIKFRYRYSKDSFFFISLLNDEGPYRKFRWCDSI